MKDRASIVSDAYALVKAGRMGADQLVRLLPAYKEEDNSTVWKAVDSVLLALDKVHNLKLDKVPTISAGDSIRYIQDPR